jgi:hypothetical protein
MIVRIQSESIMIHSLVKNHFYFFNRFKTYENTLLVIIPIIYYIIMIIRLLEVLTKLRFSNESQ